MKNVRHEPSRGGASGPEPEGEGQPRFKDILLVRPTTKKCFFWGGEETLSRDLTFSPNFMPTFKEAGRDREIRERKHRRLRKKNINSNASLFLPQQQLVIARFSKSSPPPRSRFCNPIVCNFQRHPIRHRAPVTRWLTSVNAWGGTAVMAPR